MKGFKVACSLILFGVILTASASSNLRAGQKHTMKKPVNLPAAAKSSSSIQVISLEHRPSPTPLRGARKHTFLRPSSGHNVTDKAAEVLAQFDQALPAYFARLDFNGQLIDVLVDTGSSNLLIPAATQCDACDQSVVTQRLNLTKAGAQLVACENAACRGSCTPEELDNSKIPDLFCGPHGGTCTHITKFTDAMELNNAQSSAVDNVCLFYDRYGDGSYAAGFIAHSDVELAGYKVDAVYGAITGASRNFYEAPQGGGIMGMSFGGRLDCNSFSCIAANLFNSIVTAAAVNDIFAMCGGSKSSPVLLVGGGDHRLYQGEIAYVPLVPPYAFYSVAVQDVKIGADAQVSLGKGRVPPPVIIDTGTSGIILPGFIYSAFKEYLQANFCDVPFVCEGSPSPSTIFDDICVTDPQGLLPGLPPLSIRVGAQGFPLTVTSTQYMQPAVDTDGTVYYCLQFAGGMAVDDSDVFLIGETLLNHYYVEFDRDKLRLGFAPSVSDCAGSIQATS